MPTILVADDNSNIQKMVSLVFKEKGIRVVAVGNGEAACRKVPEVHPDVVLADVFMPVRNGYEVCEFVKQDPQFAETPVILLVGAFDPLDEKEAQRVGANGVLKKPFVPPEPLLAMVSALLKMDVPPVEQAPQAVQAAPEPPPAPVAPTPTARERSRAAVSNDYDDADEIAPTFGEPVATPAARASGADEEVEDDSDPGSEWARRRATMDYEIDAAESANMVEKLAAGNTTEDAQILPGNKHLPFGGANVSEVSAAAPQSSHTSWPDLKVPEVTDERSTEMARPDSVVEESSPLTTEKWETTSPQTELERGDRGESSAPLPVGEETPSPEAEQATVYGGAILESEELSNDATQEAPSAQQASPSAWPLPQAPQPSEASLAQADATEPPAIRQEPSETIVKPPLALPVTSHPAIEDLNIASEPLPAVETAADEPVPQESIDQATVDDLVARVISKLEPQLHQALANGVLRPLVEEVLNQRRRDKK